MTVDYQRLVSAAVERGDAEDWYRLGCLLNDLRRWGAAAGCFARAVQKEPDNHRYLTNWGWMAHLMGDSAAACERLRRAVELAPSEAQPHNLLCQVLTTLGRTGDAVAMGQRGVELEPMQAINHVGYGIALMSAGEWREGWREYEHRFAYKIPEFLTRPFPLWRGEGVNALYLEGEQGLGDTIFALRWLSQVCERAGHVTVYLQKEAVPLVRGAMKLPVNCRLRPLPQPFPKAEAWCPLLSLPVAMDLERTVDAPYLRAPWDWRGFGEREARDAVAWLGGGRKIGICWSGNPTHEMAHHRDCPLPHWLWMAELPGIELHSLQVGPGRAQQDELATHGLIRDRSPEITNLLDTARIIAEMDLVVTVDTAVAHLAGAMGKPCWMLVNQKGTDFRWGREGERTGWYPSVRIFRRSLEEQSWNEVMLRVAAALKDLP